MKFQKLTRGGFKYRIYAEDGGGSHPIHGALNVGGWWTVMVWKKDGLANAFDTDGSYDLVPEKKRRFKTNEELITSGYTSITFRDTVISVMHQGSTYQRFKEQTLEDLDLYYLEIFTVEEG